MSFARHETFYFRDGWLRKGMKLTNKYGFDFFKSQDAPDVLGMGKNMVQSLRYWLQATQLVEPKEKKNKTYDLSNFGKYILENDPYFEDEGTLWLIHYNLASNKEIATTFYWFFNIFNHKEFDDETFLYWLNNYTITENYKVAESSLRKDYQCLVNTYLFEKKLLKSNSPEDNLNCPLRNLKLLKKIGPRTYQLNRVNRSSLHPYIFYYTVKTWQQNNDQPLEITISNIFESHNNAGKIFNLSLDDIIYYLEECQKLNLLNVKRTAGLDAVNLKNIDPLEALDEYYSQKGVSLNA